jgi:hypothetical protein
MSETIALRQQVSREQVEEDLKTSFPGKLVKRSILGKIVLHEDSRISASIRVLGDRIKVRAHHRLGDFLILTIFGTLGRAPTEVGDFAEIRRSKKETEQKYSDWIRAKHGVT